MAFNVTTTLLDALVLSVVSKEDTYGYKITQEVKEAIDISDSTLYPVLRRLQKDDCLNIYDVEHSGRNRRYYKITNKGKLQLALYRNGKSSKTKSTMC
jgi:PadR family transcriptional regulator PadR